MNSNLGGRQSVRTGEGGGGGLVIVALTADPTVTATAGGVFTVGTYGGQVFVHLTADEDTSWLNLSYILSVGDLYQLRWLLNADGVRGRLEDFLRASGAAMHAIDKREGRYYRLMVATDEQEWAENHKPRWLDLTQLRDVMGNRASAALSVAVDLSKLQDNDQVQIPDYSGGYIVLEIKRTGGYTPTPGAITIDCQTAVSAQDALVRICNVIAGFGWLVGGLTGGATEFQATLLAPHVGANWNGTVNAWVIVSPAAGLTFLQPADGEDGLAMLDSQTDFTNLVSIVSCGPDKTIWDLNFENRSEIILPDLDPTKRYRFCIRVSSQSEVAPLSAWLEPAAGQTQCYYLTAGATIPAGPLLIGCGDSVTGPSATGVLEPIYQGCHDWQSFGQIFPHTTGASFAAFGGVNAITDGHRGWKVRFSVPDGEIIPTASGHLRIVEEHAPAHLA